MESALDMSVYDADRLRPRELVAFTPYLTANRTETVLALGTRDRRPRVLRSWPLDAFTAESNGKEAWDFWTGAKPDAVTIVAFTLSPYRADQVASRCLWDETVPQALQEGRLVWNYGDREWSLLDHSVTALDQVTPLRPADPVLARLWALRLHSQLAAHSQPTVPGAVTLPDFRAIPDRTHLAAWADLPLEWLLDNETLTVAEAHDFATGLLSADNGPMAAAAIDWILASSSDTDTRIDLWQRAARASDGPPRAAAAALAALALWRWGDPARTEAAAYALAAQPRSLLANFIADLIATASEPAPGLFDAWPGDPTPIA